MAFRLNAPLSSLDPIRVHGHPITEPVKSLLSPPGCYVLGCGCLFVCVPDNSKSNKHNIFQECFFVFNVRPKE